MIVEVEVEAPGWETALPGAASIARGAAETALEVMNADGELAVLLTDDDAVHALNARFRDTHAATNVLAFPAPAAPATQGPPGAERQLGDVALALGVCTAEAAAQGKPLAAHLAHLVAHGVLHLLGCDHDEDAQAEAMEGFERVILARLGWPDPYALERGSAA